MGDVDFMRRELAVSRQVLRRTGGGVNIRLPKYGSERVVPLADELFAILSRHVKLAHRTEWLFAGGEAYPPDQNTAGYWWRISTARAGVTGFSLTHCGTSSPAA